MKKFKIVNIVLIFMLFITMCLYNASNISAEDGLYVNDHANLLDSRDLGKLKETLSVISEQWDADVVVITEETINGQEPSAYADDYFDYNGYREDGVLLLIVMDTRDWYISTTGSCINTFTDDGIQYIGDEIVEDLGDGDYYSAFNTYAELCDKFLDKDSTGVPYDGSNMPKTNKSLFIDIIIGIVASLVITSIIIAVLALANKSVRHVNVANDYFIKNSLRMYNSNESFLYKNVVRTKIETDSGGGSSTHFGSSGGSHGGGGGKF